MSSQRDYRKRIYDNYISSNWKYSHNLSEETFDFYAKVYRKRFKGLLPEEKGARIIDVACGSGHFLSFLQKEGYTNAEGIDLSEEQLEVAGRLGVKNLKKADLFEYLPEISGSFDMVVANDIIEHLKKDEVLEFLDRRSTVRCGLWWVVEKLLKLYLTVERGTGRGMWKQDYILEPRIFAVGRRPE